MSIILLDFQSFCFQRIAESHGTPLYQLGHILPGYKHDAAQWVGADPEEINRNIARATALLFKSHYFLTPMSDLSDEDFEIAVKEGLEARPPCRFEIFKVQTRRPGNAMKVIKILPNEIVTANAQLVLFDIAHNEAAISAMVLKLKERFAGWNIR